MAPEVVRVATASVGIKVTRLESLQLSPRCAALRLLLSKPPQYA